MTDKKHQIHEFSPTIYPFRLWVSVNPSFEDVKDKVSKLKEDLSEEKMEIKEEDIVVSRTFDNEEGENK